VGGTCSPKGGKKEMRIGYWWGSQRERDHKEDQDVGGWIIRIKMDLLEIGWRGVDWIGTIGFHKMLGKYQIAT
jgi:hypothetical protein